MDVLEEFRYTNFFFFVIRLHYCSRSAAIWKKMWIFIVHWFVPMAPNYLWKS